MSSEHLFSGGALDAYLIPYLCQSLFCTDFSFDQSCQEDSSNVEVSTSFSNDSFSLYGKSHPSGISRVPNL